MKTAIIIALIVCGINIIVSVIGAILTAQARKEITRRINAFDKAFPNMKRSTNDDLPKFGDF